MSLYLSRIEGSPPKRNAPGSNPGRDNKKRRRPHYQDLRLFYSTLHYEFHFS